ncbi:hypothetical protein IDAT_11455 [Pseudidiomarina atlantica]|uniref:Uncharacterized protein n=1 Tax=Pseudidiomarina atlantica TaxID=1517416 RepID=A0A094IQQ3_9GAMM|nr:hypothetical protein [Pseudidiomarina atlantica]KFZ28184.1 hypothetical protein IDAT_11455 [Pseudidiomarina atlantica]
MINLLAVIVLSLAITSSSELETVEIYYKGFWSHSPFPAPLEELKHDYILSVHSTKTSVPTKYLSILTDDFQPIKRRATSVEYVFYFVERNQAGVVVREVAGTHESLFDLTHGTYKEISESERILLNNYIKAVSKDSSDFLPYKNHGS